VLILCSLQCTLGKSVVVSGERVMPQGVRVFPPAPKKSLIMIDYLKKNKRIVLIILVIAFIELSGYGILASLSRLLNAL